MKRLMLSVVVFCSVIVPVMHGVPVKGKPSFYWPIQKDKFWISSYFGSKERGRLHSGVDLAALKGTVVRASANGIVEESKTMDKYGKMVLLSHTNGYKTRYAHLDRMLVKKGSAVTRGQIIGYVGNTGHVSGKNGEHLHFEILAKNEPVNPMKFLA